MVYTWPMDPLKDAQIAEYFHRSYTAVDGLWFMKLEERFGFDTALEIDVAVWQVMPKIQARKLKELTGLQSGLDALHDCLAAKLRIEGFAFTARRGPDGASLEIVIEQCPWRGMLEKSGRGHLAGTIGERICTTEYGVWAREFGGEAITFAFGGRLCGGCECCVLRFNSTSE